MITNVKSYYDLLNFGLGDKSFQQFIDKFKLKYNAPQTDGFVFDNDIQMDYTYQQLIAAQNVATLPIYVDAESEALDKKLGDFKIGENEIPTQKHGYALDKKLLRQRMIMIQKFGSAALTPDTQKAVLSLLFDSSDMLLKGNANALTHQRQQIVSRGGEFEISLSNNPRGLKGLKFDFGVPAENKETLSGTAKWWIEAEHTTSKEGSTSDPLGYMKKKVRWYKKNRIAKGFHIEISDDLLEDLYSHSKVLKAIALSMFPNSDNANLDSIGANILDEAKLSQMSKIVGCPIIARDSKAYVEKFDETTKDNKIEAINNFVVTNFAIVPDTQLGTIKAVQPISMGNPAERTAWFDGGRTLITTSFEKDVMRVESEMAMLCVPNVPKYMCAYTVTA